MTTVVEPVRNIPVSRCIRQGADEQTAKADLQSSVTLGIWYSFSLIRSEKGFIWLQQSRNLDWMRLVQPL